MNVELQPDPADGLNVTVHVTFDAEFDGQDPQPWRLYIVELQDTHDVASGTADLSVTLPTQGIYTFNIAGNTSTARVKYSTGSPGEVVVGGPHINTIEPTAVSADGYAEVKLHGTGFNWPPGVVDDTGAEVTAVYHGASGDIPAESWSVEIFSAVEMDADFQGAGNVEDGTIELIHPTTLEPLSNAVAFSWVAAPTLASAVPANGPLAGGTPVVLTGTGLSGAYHITFNGQGQDQFTVDSDTQISVTSPEGFQEGLGTIDVQTTGDGYASTPWTYDAEAAPLPPNISSITPNTAQNDTATAIAIDGYNLAGATAVTVGGEACVVGAVTDMGSYDQLACTTPVTALTGDVDVVVTTPGGSDTQAGFVLTAAGPPPPVITSITPDTVSFSTGGAVTLAGSNFTGATRVDFQNTQATNVAVVDDATITCTAPPSETGTSAQVSVKVYTDHGNSDFFFPFNYSSSGPGTEE